MRNLKKILALVLALMMVLSVMVTASAASFTDDVAITHTEAVDVMVAAGVLNGKPAADGTYYFDPTGTIDRASAAKLIAYLKLGTLIDAVVPANTEFPDVPAGQWASGYIAYCADNNIVVGSTNGNFNPTNAVDGHSFAKMLLLALGREDLDTTAEYNYITGEWKVAPYTGNSWALKVRVALSTLKGEGTDLLAGLEDVSLNQPLSREHAAQMVFNALVGTGKIADYKLTYTAKTVDSFGRPSVNVWTNAKGEVVHSEPVEAVAKYTAKTDDKTIKADLGIETLSQNVTANGKLVEYYLSAVAADGTKTYTRVVVDYTVATIGIGKADEKTGDVTYTLGTDKYYDYADNTKKADTIALNGEIVDKAVVTYAVDNKGVAHVYPTTSVAGTLNARNSAGTLTIGTDKYYLSTAANSSDISVYNFNIKDFSVQLDQYGYVVCLTPEVAPVVTPSVVTDYIYVLDYAAQAYVKGEDAVTDIFGNVTTAAKPGVEAKAVATVVTAAGEKLVVELALTAVKNEKGEITGYTYEQPSATGVNEKTTLVDAKAPVAVNTWLAYTVNEDGTYTLSDLNKDYALVSTGLTLKKGETNKATIGGVAKYITSSTVITGIYAKDSKYYTDGFTGLATSDIAISGKSVLYVTNPKTNVVTNVIVYGAPVTTAAPVAPAAATYAYAAAKGDEVANGTLWTVYANGVEHEIVVSTGTYVKGGVYKVTAYAGTEEALKGTYVMEQVSMTEGVVTLTDTTFFMVGADDHYYGKDAVVYNATTGAADTIEVGDTVIWNADCTLIYIVKEAKAD